MWLELVAESIHAGGGDSWRVVIEAQNMKTASVLGHEGPRRGLSDQVADSLAERQPMTSRVCFCDFHGVVLEFEGCPAHVSIMTRQ